MPHDDDELFGGDDDLFAGDEFESLDALRDEEEEDEENEFGDDMDFGSFGDEEGYDNDF